MTASKVDVTTETEVLVVKDTGYYDMYSVVDLDEVSLLAMHHMQTSEYANVGAGVGGGFKNTKELKVMSKDSTTMARQSAHQLQTQQLLELC
jgi:hypothetical protein